MKTYLSNNYKRLPVSFSYGKGAHLYDKNNTPHLDLISGISVCNLGHTHPNIVNTICQQAQRLLHTSNLYEIEQQEQLAKKLCALTNLSGVYFCNSGSEANETSIKLARLHAKKRKIAQHKIIVFEKAFHGRSIANLSASDNPLAQKGFEPLLDDFIRLPINDYKALEQTFSENNNVVAVWFEAVQGEGGVHLLNDDFLQKIEQLCQQYDALLMADEIQCGMGRTGLWMGYQTAGIKPDVVTLAKALGNGLPIGACLMNEHTKRLLAPGQHGSTFGGNPLCCAVASSVLKTIEDDNLLEHVQLLSQYIDESWLPNNTFTLRKKGLMIGIEHPNITPKLTEQALKKKLLVNVTDKNVLRLLPPFVIKPLEWQHALEKLYSLLKLC